MMKAILYTAGEKGWSRVLGSIPWAMLPVANRPLIEYWLELCAEIGIEDVQIVLGDGAAQIETYVGDGERWGVKVQYSFARASERPVDYLLQSQRADEAGVFFVCDWIFLRRRSRFSSRFYEGEGVLSRYDRGELLLLFGRDGKQVCDLLEQQGESATGQAVSHEAAQDVELCRISDIRAYFELNMRMVGGEFSRYVTAGFSNEEGSSIGYNVLTPPSVRLQAPLIIGNDCRIGALSTIGPNAIISSHVIVDRQSELSNCLILPDTYIGQNLEIEGKIVSGNRLISPDDGMMMEIEDSWIVAKNRPEMTSEDLFRWILLWCFGFLLALIQVVPFLFLYLLIFVTGKGLFRRKVFHDSRLGMIKLPVFRKRMVKRSYLISLFRAASLDKFPQLILALRGRLFLCGQKPLKHPEDDALVPQIPLYLPAVFYYGDYTRESDALVDALWYAHARSLFEDLKIVAKALMYRFFRAGRY
jgi:NDP-sugar pyrophosphorylase family protein